jgi:hypothetical protein
MDYVITTDGTIKAMDGKPYTGYVKDCDWHTAVARGRRPARPPLHMDFRPKPVLRPKGQGYGL